MPLARFLRFAVGLLATAALVTRLPAAEPASTAIAATTVELPPLSVVATKGTQPWQYAELPGIEVLSRCSGKTTREFIASWYRLSQILRLVIPMEYQGRQSLPETFILTNTGRVPATTSEVVAAPATANETRTASAANVRILPNLRLGDRDSSVLMVILDERWFDADKMFFTKEQMIALLDRRTPPLPPWLKEGLRNLMNRMAFFEGGVVIGLPDRITYPADSRVRSNDKAPRILISMSELLTYEPTPEDESLWPTDVSLWKAQAGLFVRWALDGQDDARRAAFWKFVGRACEAPVTEEMFRDCFGFGYAVARDRLSDCLPTAIRSPVYLQAKNLLELPPLKLRDATPAEIGRLKGEWERLEIGDVKKRHPQYVPQYQEQAHATLTQAYEADPNDPRLLAVIGLYEIDVGNVSQARSYLEVAARAKVVRPRVYYELTRLRYNEARAVLADSKDNLGASRMNSVLEPLLAGRAQQPPLIENYLLAAEVWAHSDVKLDKRSLDLLDEGLRLFPKHSLLLYKAALVYALQGFKTEALALIERGLRNTPTDAVRSSLLKLQATLTPPSAAPAPVSSAGQRPGSGS